MQFKEAWKGGSHQASRELSPLLLASVRSHWQCNWIDMQEVAPPAVCYSQSLAKMWILKQQQGIAPETKSKWSCLSLMLAFQHILKHTRHAFESLTAVKWSRKLKKNAQGVSIRSNCAQRKDRWRQTDGHVGDGRFYGESWTPALLRFYWFISKGEPSFSEGWGIEQRSVWGESTRSP